MDTDNLKEKNKDKYFLNLAKKMRMYGHSYWIYLVGMSLVFLIAIYQFTFILSINRNNNIGFYDIVEYFAFVIIIAVGVWIYKFIRFVSFILGLKKTADETNLELLIKSSKLQILALVFQILSIVFHIVSVGIIIKSLNINDISEIQIYNSNLFYFIGNLFLVAMYIFNLIAFVKISSWGQTLIVNNRYRYSLKKMVGGFNILKISSGISITLIFIDFLKIQFLTNLTSFVNIVCIILFSIGFIKSGSNMNYIFMNKYNAPIRTSSTTKNFSHYKNHNQNQNQNKFKNHYQNQNQNQIHQIQNQIQKQIHQIQKQNKNHNHNQNLKQIQNQNQNQNQNQALSRNSNDCPFCGEPISYISSIFCSKCGRKLN